MIVVTFRAFDQISAQVFINNESWVLIHAHIKKTCNTYELIAIQEIKAFNFLPLSHLTNIQTNH